ncbi:peptidylprolyl isomerase [Paenibacillus sp. sgz500958]|uniref:peptidylprolyl isomerase n=1 Tax=Paenibacillus sp. sgz500958 TaxID=3242475 RepID=UPI0036D244F7
MSLNNKKSWKVLLVSLVAAVSFSMLSACSNNNSNTSAEDTSAAVATYDGGTITENEFNMDQQVMKFLSPEQAQYLEIAEFKESILKQEVAFEYLAGKASDDAKKEAEKEADVQVSKMKESLGDTYESTLKEQKISESDIRTYMVRVLTVYQDMLLKVKDEEVTKYFEENKGDFTVATLRHILIQFKDSEGKERTKEETLKLAQDVKAKLDGGADFAETAKQYSEDPGSKDAGGQYKDATLGTYVEEFKKAAQTLPLNTISDPVETAYGYHVMKVESRTEKTFDQLTDDEKEQIKSSVASANLQTFLEKDLDGIVKSINLPKSSAPAATDGGTEPSASPAATEAAK